MRPVIGISCGQRGKSLELVLRKEYPQQIFGAGGLPFVIPISLDQAFLSELFLKCDGLLLTGGGDLDPSSYRGKSNLHLSRNIDGERDGYEQWLLKLAQTGNRPVLAICRGMQLVNTYCGGTLFQDIEAEIPSIQRHQHLPGSRTVLHEEWNQAGSKIHIILGECRCVNSNHHQAVKEVGAGLTATAFSDDGIVEAIEGSGSWWLLGVQWHPERLTGRQAMPELFASFIQAAANHT